MASKKLTRSSSDRYLAGVLGGFGQYFNVNPKWLRIGYLVATLLTTVVPGVLIYIMMALIMPSDRQTPSLFDWLKQTGTTTSGQRERKILHNVEEHDVKSGKEH